VGPIRQSAECVTNGRADCTFCNANPLVGGRGSGGSLIDHILARDLAAPVRVEPFLRQPLSITVGNSSRRTAYSDHYGLLGVVDPTPTTATP